VCAGRTHDGTRHAAGGLLPSAPRPNYMTSSVGSLVPAVATAVSRNTNDDDPSANLSRGPQVVLRGDQTTPRDEPAPRRHASGEVSQGWHNRAQALAVPGAGRASR
jgi:hypothetical protein